MTVFVSECFLVACVVAGLLVPRRFTLACVIGAFLGAFSFGECKPPPAKTGFADAFLVARWSLGSRVGGRKSASRILAA
jgi:hypothetical protein